MNDILGTAIKDYYDGHKHYKLWIYNTYGSKEAMPISTYFRSYMQMPEIELLALEACSGKVLDVGAGAGSHSLVLQQRNFNVTALDISANSCTVMQERGVKQVINADICSFKRKKFNTLLLLMNGIGIASTLNGLHQLIMHLKTLLKPGGQIIFDSSDVAYLYTNKTLPQHYYGEIEYAYRYRGKSSGWFRWLYIDKKTMKNIASACDFNFQILYEDDGDHYLARLT